MSWSSKDEIIRRKIDILQAQGKHIYELRVKDKKAKENIFVIHGVLEPHVVDLINTLGIKFCSKKLTSKYKDQLEIPYHLIEIQSEKFECPMFEGTAEFDLNELLGCPPDQIGNLLSGKLSIKDLKRDINVTEQPVKKS